MNKINFKAEGSEVSINNGKDFVSIPDKVYRDAPRSLLGSLVERVESGEHWKKLVESEIRPRNAWLADIIVSPLRNSFLSLIDGYKEGALGLDVGAGWGQHTVEMSRTCKVCCVEPSPERFKFLKAVCEQESVSGNCFFVNAGLSQLEFDALFDFAICIGVLEWVGKFEDCKNPRESQLKFLMNIKRSLRKGASLLIGIENRMGLKYLMGSNDDHVGLPHILCMDFESADRHWTELKGENLKVATYTMSEYKLLLEEAGFSSFVFHAALPDYKMPEEILECYPNDRFSEYLVTGSFIEERDGSNGKDHKINPQLKSLYRTFGEERIAPLFAPSYFIVAK